MKDLVLQEYFSSEPRLGQIKKRHLFYVFFLIVIHYDTTIGISLPETKTFKTDLRRKPLPNKIDCTCDLNALVYTLLWASHVPNRLMLGWAGLGPR
jgi:hypothetical protein